MHLGQAMNLIISSEHVVAGNCQAVLSLVFNNCSLLHSTDSDSEVSAVQRIARQAGASDAIACNHWARGGEGAEELARAVETACQQLKDFKFLYDLKVGRILQK